MEFGKRSRGALQNVLHPLDRSAAPIAGAALPKPVTPRKRFAATALAGVLLGFGGVTAGTTFVQASERAGLFNLFGTLFGAPPQQQAVVVEPRRAPKRYSALPDARRLGAARQRHHTPRPVAGTPDLRSRGRGSLRPETTPIVSVGHGGPQTVCVRTCDGYLFPLGRLGAQKDIPVHQAACAAACPHAATALFTLPAGRGELDQAVSLKGQPYLAAAWANVYRQKRVENCSCQPPGVAAMPLAIGSDATVRIGDVVTTEDGANVVTDLVRGRVRVADYRTARNLSRGARGEIDRRVGALRRDAAEAAFRKALRVADAKAGAKVDTTSVRVRLAEAGAARLRTMEAAPGLTAVEPASDGRQSFAPVRVVSTSLYGP